VRRRAIHRRRINRRRKSPSHSDARRVRDMSVWIYVIRNRPAAPRERFNRLAEAISISTAPRDRRDEA